MIFCKDCNHVREGEIFECHHPRNSGVSFIDGSTFQKKSLFEFRMDICEVDKAIYFEPKRGD